MMPRFALPEAWARIGLRSKIAIALFSCALLSLGVGTAVSSYFSERALRIEVSEKLGRSMDQEILGIEHRLDRALYDLTTISENRVMQDVLIADDMGEIADSLSAFQSRYSEFSGLFVVDETGAVIASHGIELPPDFLFQLDQLQESLAGRTFVSSFGQYPEVAGDSSLFSVPIKADYDPDTVIGVLFARLSIEQLWDRLSVVPVAEQAQGQGRLLFLTAGDAQTIYRTDAPEAADIAQNLTQAAVREQQGTSPSVVSDAERYLVSSAGLTLGPFSHLGLQLYSAVSEDIAFSSVVRLKHNLTLTTALLALGMLPLGWFGARTLTGPLSAVTAAMTRLARNAESQDLTGGLGAGRDSLIPASVLARQDEMGLLGRSFATLIDQLAQARAKLIEQSEAEISKRNQRLDAALNNMSQGLCMFGPDERLIVNNRRFEEIYELSEGAIRPGMHIREVLETCRNAGHHTDDRLGEIEAVLAEQIRARRPFAYLETIKDERVVSVIRVPMPNGGWVTTFEDVTQRKQAEAQIEYMAHHDALTDLPNRVMFRQKLDEAISSTSRGKKVAVLCLDLDHFKAVNDTLGHPVGDELLRAVADRLRACVRHSSVVARLGGDEFAIVEIDTSSLEEPRALAERVIEALGQPFEIFGHQIAIGTSVGIALAPMDGTNADELVKAADMALYRAKTDGRGTFRFFEKEMDAHMQRRRALELDLRKALVNGEFEVYYQPIVSLKTERVSCFEALLRWRHPNRGSVPPSDFIPLAEEIGLISQIGAWVLQQACHAAAEWPSDVRVAVNLSPAQFRTQILVSEVEAALSSSGLPPERLELEITETILLQQTEQTLSILNQLRALGVRISMDDFGTGYSSLGYLRTFPFDKLKIDQSFIRDLGKDGDALAIVRAISGLGISLGMTTTAEGVETLGQMEQLRIEGCNEVQGYYFSPAVRAAETPGLIAGIGPTQGSTSEGVVPARPVIAPRHLLHRQPAGSLALDLT